MCIRDRSDTSKKSGANNLDPEQLKYVDDLQKSIVKRIESIITPIVGLKNVRAEASAEVDFSSLEQAAETYKPNQKPEDVTIRSMQSNESKTSNGESTASGIPGALSNQPPATPTAPITAEAGAAEGSSTAATTPNPFNVQKNTTTNFEVDKTVRYVQQAMGGIKRLNVAVVVNNMPETDKAGKVTYRPLTAAEKKQINDLAMQAMGFNKERGDSLTVVNSSFAGEPTEKLPEVPMWKNPVLIEYVKDILRLLAGVIGMLMLYKKILKPLFNKLAEPIALLAHNPDSVVSISGGQEMIEAGRNGMAGYDKNLGTVKQIAANNPRMVANVVAGWTNGTDK